MHLMRNEFKAREAERSSFRREFIRQYKRNASLPKRDCIRLCAAARLAIAECLGIKAPKGGRDTYLLEHRREMAAYWRSDLGFKDDTEFLQFCQETWRERLQYESF